MSEIRVLPLPKVTGIWRHEFSRYPDMVKVPMSDGRVISYVIDVDQPAPVLRDSLERFHKMCIGYQAEKEKPADAATPDRPTKKKYRNHYNTKEDK